MSHGNWKVVYDYHCADTWEYTRHPKEKEKELVLRTDSGDEGVCAIKDLCWHIRGLGTEVKISCTAWHKVYVITPYEVFIIIFLLHPCYTFQMPWCTNPDTPPHGMTQT